MVSFQDDDQINQLTGQVESGSNLPELARLLTSKQLRAEVLESTHYKGGQYLKVDDGQESLVFERISTGEYRVGGEADSLGKLRNIAWLVSGRLKEADLRHRLMLYYRENALHGFFHHQWPLLAAVVCGLEREKDRVSALSSVLTSVKIEGTTRLFERIDQLSTKLQNMAEKNNVMIWISDEDGDKEEQALIELQQPLFTRYGCRLVLLKFSNKKILHMISPGLKKDFELKEIHWPIAVSKELFPGMDFSWRKVITVEDVFDISGRGQMVVPEISPDVLSRDQWPRVRVEVRPHERKIFTTFATATTMMGTGTSQPGRTMLIRDTKKEDIPVGSEIWLCGEAEKKENVYRARILVPLCLTKNASFVTFEPEIQVTLNCYSCQASRRTVRFHPDPAKTRCTKENHLFPGFLKALNTETNEAEKTKGIFAESDESFGHVTREQPAAFSYIDHRKPTTMPGPDQAKNICEGISEGSRVATAAYEIEYEFREFSDKKRPTYPILPEPASAQVVFHILCKCGQTITERTSNNLPFPWKVICKCDRVLAEERIETPILEKAWKVQ